MKKSAEKAIQSGSFKYFKNDMMHADYVAVMFNVCKRTLDNWVESGLPRYKTGRDVYYKVSEIERFIETYQYI